MHAIAAAARIWQFASAASHAFLRFRTRTAAFTHPVFAETRRRTRVRRILVDGLTRCAVRDKAARLQGEVGSTTWHCGD